MTYYLSMLNGRLCEASIGILTVVLNRVADAPNLQSTLVLSTTCLPKRLKMKLEALPLG